MKKVIIIVAVVVLIVALVIGGVFFMLTRQKTAVTIEGFKTVAEEKGYTVGDIQNQFSEYEYIEKAQVAVSKDYNYLIEFYVIDSEENAKAFYNNNKVTLEAMKQENSIDTTTSINNYDIYTLKAGGKYMYIARVDNTIVYANVSDSVENNIKEFMKALGY